MRKITEYYLNTCKGKYEFEFEFPLTTVIRSVVQRDGALYLAVEEEPDVKFTQKYKVFVVRYTKDGFCLPITNKELSYVGGAVIHDSLYHTDDKSYHIYYTKLN